MEQTHRVWILGMYIVACGLFYTLIVLFNLPEEKSEETAIVRKYDYVKHNIHDVDSQYVSTTFHDYTVVIDDGKVVANGVIHHANCKCKNQ